MWIWMLPPRMIFPSITDEDPPSLSLSLYAYVGECEDVLAM